MVTQDKEWRWRYYQEIEASLVDVRSERSPSSSHPLNLQIAREKIHEDRQGFLTARIEWDNDRVRELDELETTVTEVQEIHESRKRNKRQRMAALAPFLQ